jgi:DNA-binding FadR family transcriptional regulator
MREPKAHDGLVLDAPGNVGGRRRPMQDRTAVALAKDLLRRIATGRRAGDPLPSEAVLAQQYEVGRSSLREALLILELNGFVAIRPGAKGGPVVTDGGAEAFGEMASMHFQHAQVTLGELLQARVAFEPFGARLAAGRRDDGALAPLVALMEESATLDTSDSRSYHACSDRFHAAVASLSGNKVLDLVGAAIHKIYSARLPGPLTPAEGRDRVMQEHIEIGQAIVDGDAARAERLMRTHMAALAEAITQRSRDLLDEVIAWQ